MMGSIVPLVTQMTWRRFMKVIAFLPLRLQKYLGLKEFSVKEVNGRVIECTLAYRFDHCGH